MRGKDIGYLDFGFPLGAIVFRRQSLSHPSGRCGHDAGRRPEWPEIIHTRNQIKETFVPLADGFALRRRYSSSSEARKSVIFHSSLYFLSFSW